MPESCYDCNFCYDGIICDLYSIKGEVSKFIDDPNSTESLNIYSSKPSFCKAKELIIVEED